MPMTSARSTRPIRCPPPLPNKPRASPPNEPAHLLHGHRGLAQHEAQQRRQQQQAQGEREPAAAVQKHLRKRGVTMGRGSRCCRSAGRGRRPKARAPFTTRPPAHALHLQRTHARMHACPITHSRHAHIQTRLPLETGHAGHARMSGPLDEKGTPNMEEH